MEAAIIIISSISLILSAVTLWMLISLKNEKNNNAELERRLDELSRRLGEITEENRRSQSELRQEINAGINSSTAALGTRLLAASRERDSAQTELLKTMSGNMDGKLRDMKASMDAQLRQFETRFGTLEKNTEQRLDGIRQSVEGRLDRIAQDNTAQLDKIRGTVDEKLQSTLEKKMNESFRLVSERLEQVYKGLGEMQTIAQGVGDLKNVLSNVKTRGVLGEIQLGAILSDILAPEQYETETATIPGSRDRVEFAVKLPTANDGEHIYLPIDSKFNADRYVQLQKAYDSGSRDEIDAAKKELAAAIRKNAKDIRDKYIQPPHTTAFGIMFLPFEGLYAEVVSSGLVDELQRNYNVNIAGPSTMAAMLNALQMSFRTLAVQKRSAEVWKTLSAVRTEFDKFAKALEDTKAQIRKAESSLDDLVGVRTRQIRRKLKDVEYIDSAESAKLLDDSGE